MTGGRFLVLGAGEGWHASQLQSAFQRAGCEMHSAGYESLSGYLGEQKGAVIDCEAGRLSEFDAILTRTMPAASLERITFRLAALHALELTTIVNPPRALEIAIDKFATLDCVSALGYLVPETIVVQSRSQAMDAFDRLGGDCVIKPLFGGEGRGVMRVRDRELAWYATSTLDNLGATLYLQKFIGPGGVDTRLLVIGEEVIGIRRSNDREFRTNLSSGARGQAINPTPNQVAMAQAICRRIGLWFAAVDLLHDAQGNEFVLEVNAIPGWKGAQQVISENIADKIVQLMKSAR